MGARVQWHTLTIPKPRPGFGGILNPYKLILTLRIPERHILAPNHVFEPAYVEIRSEVWSVDKLTKQEGEAEEVTNRESGTVNFTHIGSHFLKTNRYEIWQFSSSDQRNHSFKIWC